MRNELLKNYLLPYQEYQIKKDWGKKTLPLFKKKRLKTLHGLRSLSMDL